MNDVTIKNVSVSKLALALSKAQNKIKPPVKNRKVDFLDKNGRRVKYNYADLADLIESYRDPLAENELAVFSSLVFENIKGDETSIYGLKTVLVHSSGEFIDTFYPLPDPMLQNIKAQEFGSALTYARRYSISTLIGIASEEDDDGGIAAETKPPVKKQETTQRQPQQQQRPQSQQESNNSKFASKEQVAEIYAIGRKKKFSDADIFKIIKNVAGDVKSSHEIPSMAVGIIYSFLEKNEPGDLK